MSKMETNAKADEVIGYCPGCNQSIMESQPTKLVLGQLYHEQHAPRPQRNA